MGAYTDATDAIDGAVAYAAAAGSDLFRLAIEPCSSCDQVAEAVAFYFDHAYKLWIDDVGNEFDVDVGQHKLHMVSVCVLILLWPKVRKAVVAQEVHILTKESALDLANTLLGLQLYRRKIQAIASAIPERIRLFGDGLCDHVEAALAKHQKFVIADSCSMLASRRIPEIRNYETQEPLSLVLPAVSSEPITKARAKHLWVTFCAIEETSEFCSTYTAMTGEVDDMRGVLDMPELENYDLTESRLSLSTLEKAIADAEPLLSALSSMVALYRTMTKTETRPVLCQAALANLKNIPKPLKDLLEQGMRGAGTYEKPSIK